MELSLDWKGIIYFSSVFIVVFVGSILITFGIKSIKTNVFKGLSALILGYGLFLVFLIYSGYSIRTFFFAIYWFLSIHLIYKYGEKPLRREGPLGIVWMKIYLFLFAITIVSYYIFLWSTDHQIAFDFIVFVGGMLILIIGITILYFPKIHSWEREKSAHLINEKPGLKNLEVEKISDDKKHFIEGQLIEILDYSKKYLQKNYSIHEMSKDSGVPFYQLSPYINKILGTTFLDLINSRRIEECCRMMESGDYQNITLEAIAKECGFSNRNTFIAAFKKFKNMPPSQYIKSLGGDSKIQSNQIGKI